MMFKSVIFAVAAGLASFVFAVGENAKAPVDWVDPTIGATSHMLVPAYPTVSVPFGMYRFTPPAPWFTVDEIGEMPLFLPSHRAAGMFALRLSGGRFTLDTEQRAAPRRAALCGHD